MMTSPPRNVNRAEWDGIIKRMVALAGKTSGRFATLLERYRQAFAGWEEVASGEDEYKVFFVARRGAT